MIVDPFGAWLLSDPLSALGDFADGAGGVEIVAPLPPIELSTELRNWAKASAG